MPRARCWKTTLPRLRASLGDQGVASRVSSSVSSTISTRIRAGASDVLEQARQRASDHPGVLGPADSAPSCYG